MCKASDVLNGAWWRLFWFIRLRMKHRYREHANMTCFHLSRCGSIRGAWFRPWSLASLLLLDNSTCLSGINQYCFSSAPVSSLNKIARELVGCQHYTHSIALKSQKHTNTSILAIWPGYNDISVYVLWLLITDVVVRSSKRRISKEKVSVFWHRGLHIPL